MDSTSAILDATAPRRWRWWTWLKWSLCGLVVAFVARRGYTLWTQNGGTLTEVAPNWPWLAAAAIVYLLAWLPSIWFWQRLMQRMGARLRFRDTLRAFCVGHLGKYVPGKAAAVVIRAALIRESGFRASGAALAAAYETLTMMGAGAALAVGLSPWLVSADRQATLPRWIGAVLSRAWLAPTIAAAVTIAALPLLSALFSKIARRMTPADVLESTGPVSIDMRLLARGLLVFTGCWLLLGVSLGCTLRGVGVEWSGPADLRAWTAAVTASNVLGFVAIFAPAGVGVREGALIEILQSQSAITPAQAVAAAVLYRLINLAAETLAAASLYYAVRPQAIPEDAAAHVDRPG